MKHIIRIPAIALLGFFAVTGPVSAKAADAPRQPNVLLIMTDDQGRHPCGESARDTEYRFAEAQSLGGFHR